MKNNDNRLVDFKKDTKRKVFLLSVVPLVILSTILMLNTFFILSNNAKSIYKKSICSINYKVDEFHNSMATKIKIFKKNYHNGSINIDEFLAFDRDIDSIIILDKDAKLLKIVSKNKKREMLNIKSLQKTIYKSIIKDKKKYFREIEFSSKDNYAHILYGFKFKDKIFVFDINTLEIKEFIKHLTKDISYIKIIIADKAGNYIINTFSSLLTNRSFFDTIVFKKGVKNQPQFEYIEYYNDKRDQDNIATYTINKKTNWYIVTIDTADEVDNIIYTIAWLVLFIMIVAFLVFIGVNRFTTSISKPLEILTLKMREFSTQQNVKEIDIKSKYTIFNDMANSFNIMQKRIAQKQNELEELNATLAKRVEEEVKKNEKAQLKLMQQARFVQMGEMIAMIAHQWRQPLTAINSTALKINIQAKLKKLDVELAYELSSKISQYSQHLSKTIDDFRNFFKPNKEKNLVDFQRLIAEVLSIMDASIENNNIEVIQELNCNDKFLSYSNEIKQVILNLVKNAQDALEENSIKDPKIYIRSYKKDNRCIFEVGDNAKGVPSNIIDKIFDPYFSTKSEKNGTGLGLYMSKIIIEEHCGGTISVENDKNGALFKIEIPLDIS